MTVKVTNSWNSTTYNYDFTSDTPVGETVEYITTGNYGIPPNTQIANVKEFFSIKDSNDGILVKKGGKVSFGVYNVYQNIGINHPDGFYYEQDISCENILIGYKDGTYEYLGTSNIDFVTGHGIYNINFEFVPKKDVDSVEIQTIVPIHLSNSLSSPTQITIYGGEPNKKVQLSVSQSSEESGLLNGIIEWLKGIKNGISDLFSAISDGFTNLIQGVKNVFNTLVELPGKLWTFIENGLKALFVPDDEFISNFKDSFDSLLSERFGILYDSGSLIFNSIFSMAEQMQSGEIQDYIEFPQVDLNFGDSSFSFGGWNVRIVPEGFEFLVELIRVFTTGLLFFPFINSCRKRYDRLVGDNS